MVDWLSALDLGAARANLRNEYYGDWYRDPWGWPEIEWLVDRRQDIVANRLGSADPRRPARIDVAKENFAVRPAVVLDPVDRLAYQAIVDRLSVELIGDLRPLVLGWRLPLDEPQRGKLASQRGQWDAFITQLNGHSLSHAAALKTDIVSCFARIPVDRLAERVRHRHDSGISVRLVDWLGKWSSQIQGRSGLPQRSTASSVLANLYLRPIDDYLSQRASELGGRAVRWMDDIWFFADDEAALRKVQVEIQGELEAIGLNMNSGKTAVLTDGALVDVAGNYAQSGVEAALAVRGDPAPLGALIDELLEVPEISPRTGIRFATRRIRDFEQWQFVERFIDTAERMPHAADSLARLFRDADRWSDLVDWYLDYLDSGWNAVDWSSAHLGTMFPSSVAPSQALTGQFAAFVAESDSLVVLAVASQRLASWDPDLARQAIRAGIDEAQHPLHRRVLALAAVRAGEERDLVRDWLSEFEETSVTLQMLTDQGWNLPIKADFSGG
jgi:hypothetical protein